MFDYKGLLRSGTHRLYVWQYHGAECTETLLNPLGTVIANSSQENGPCLLIDFTKFAEPVSFPSDEKVRYYFISYLLVIYACCPRQSKNASHNGGGGGGGGERVKNVYN